jgi:plasmid stabilization system protein ParE
MDEVERMIALLSRFPLVFPPFQGKAVRRCVVNKHLSIFYRLEDDQVEMLAFWDNRRNLNKLRL